MIDLNLKTYVRSFNLIPKNLRIPVVEQLKNSDEWSEHFYFDDACNQHTQKYGNTELDMIITPFSFNEKIMECVWEAVDRYIKVFNFPWMNAWGGFTNPRYNRYKDGKNMRIHCDTIQTDGKPMTPILSVVGLLNEDFEGGEFLMFGGGKIELKAGDIMVFPSNFLYPHEVLPVTSGTRYSFVSWVW